MDGTQILNMHTANWKYLKDAPTTSTPEKHNPSQTDQILTVGSVVTSVSMSIGGKTPVIKTINGDECVYIPALGGYFPTKFISEYDASDGAKDNYLANTNAKVYLDQCTVEAINIQKNLAKVHGIWVSATPLTEIKDGQ